MHRVAAAVAAVALVAVVCVSLAQLVQLVQHVQLLTGVEPHSCYAGGEPGGTGLLTVDPKFGTRVNGRPVMWPKGFTGVRHPDSVEVLDPAGKVVARTGRIYWMAAGPVFGKSYTLLRSLGAVPVAASCAPYDFFDCGPPPGSGEAIPGRTEPGAVCRLETAAASK